MHPLKGRKQSPGHVAKRVAALKAKGVYEKAGRAAAERNKARAGFKASEETRAKMSQAHKGKRYALGCKRDETFRRKLSDYWARNRSRHNHFKDGKYRERQAERGRLEYRLWREAVFARDDYTCQFCKERGGFLNADHVKPFAKFPELRFDVANGRTLCKPCHDKLHGLTKKAA